MSSWLLCFENDIQVQGLPTLPVRLDGKRVFGNLLNGIGLPILYAQLSHQCREMRRYEGAGAMSLCEAVGFFVMHGVSTGLKTRQAAEP